MRMRRSDLTVSRRKQGKKPIEYTVGGIGLSKDLLLIHTKARIGNGVYRVTIYAKKAESRKLRVGDVINVSYADGKHVIRVVRSARER